MPVKPENKARYPKDWPLIVARIRERAGNKCEFCAVPNSTKEIPVYRNNVTDEWTQDAEQATRWACMDGIKLTKIVCTTAHLDHTPENCDPSNLKFLCQRCHLAYDHGHHQQTAYATRREGKAVEDMFSDD